MRKTQLVSIIIPTYNERENVLALIPALKQVWKKRPQYRFEVIIVDDDSPDGTGRLAAKKFCNDAKVRVFIRKRKRGLGTAIRYGIGKAHGDIIVGMDADFNHDPGCLPPLLDALRRFDLAVASRFIKNGGTDDRLRYWGTLLFNFFLRLLGFPITDNVSGYYAIRKKDIEKLGVESIYYGYGEYHLRLVYSAQKKGFSFIEIPVYYHSRTYGQSKSRLVHMAVAYTIEALRLRFER